jgi:uncharacterized membrane protein YkvI
MEKIHFSGGFYGACIFLASIIGAGFATGQEVYRFFAFYGPTACWAWCCAAYYFSLSAKIR